MQGSEIQITFARNLKVSVSKIKCSVADSPCKGQDVKSSAGEMDDNSEMKERRDDLISASAFPMETPTGDREDVEEEVAKVDRHPNPVLAIVGNLTFPVKGGEEGNPCAPS